jgi:trehalose 6-phosphate phosphatase
MLDYDGTLAPFRKQRNEAIPYPEIAAKLEEIVRGGHTRVVIISGREVEEVASLLGIQPLPEMWGVYGLQRRRPDGKVEVAPFEQRYLNSLCDALRWLEYQELAGLAETKTGSLAVHWRGLSENETEEVRGRALLGWNAIARDAGLSLVEFDGGLEIRAPGIDKGGVVRMLLEEMGPGVRAAYLGDDVTDEPAFVAIGDKGLSLLVRPEWRQTAAQFWVKPPAGVLDFLCGWSDACQMRATRADMRAEAAKR